MSWSYISSNLVRLLFCFLSYLRPNLSSILVKQAIISHPYLPSHSHSTLPVSHVQKMNSLYDIIQIYHVNHVHLLISHVSQMVYLLKVVRLVISVIQLIRIVPFVEWVNLVLICKDWD